MNKNTTPAEFTSNRPALDQESVSASFSVLWEETGASNEQMENAAKRLGYTWKTHIFNEYHHAHWIEPAPPVSVTITAETQEKYRLITPKITGLDATVIKNSQV